VIAALQLAAFSWYPIADLIVRPLEERARTMAADAPPDGYAAIRVLGGVGRSPPSGSNRDPELRNPASRLACCPPVPCGSRAKDHREWGKL
jgi:uncharacterized SAM-binding protein YcdF (DUF218 family)